MKNKEISVAINTFKKLAYILALVLLTANGGIAQQTQQTQQDTASATVDTTKLTTIQEMILEEIYIEGVIETPNVAILPTREKPDFEKVDFIDRSFEHELKEGPERIFLLDSDLDAVKKIEKIKKILAKEKK
jgi:hypothetical protein